MDNSLIIFYTTIVGVYCCLLYKIPDKNYLHMVILTLITMGLIYVGQQYIVSSGKVRHGEKESSKQYHTASIPVKTDGAGGSCGCSSGSCTCGGKVVEGFDGGESAFSFMNENMNKEVNRSPKNIKDIVSGGIMGPYDGKCLAANTSSDEKYKWMKEPANTPLLDSTGFVMQGGQGPLTDRVSDDKYLTGPHLDGTSNTSQSLFMFAKNKCSPGCCPSSFSCDSGCVCTTDKQREFISRGGVMPNDSVSGSG
jgi:hypothetical protein